jgi:hypothetical protein
MNTELDTAVTIKITTMTTAIRVEGSGEDINGTLWMKVGLMV